MNDLHHVVVIGGGFGGIHAVKTLKKHPVRVTLLDKRNFHLFQPLLYQVATGALSPANIAAPLRGIFKHQKNATVLLANVIGIDPIGKRVLFDDGDLAYDSVIVACGSGSSYFGHDEWQSTAPGLKSIEEATEIRRRFLLAFEDAERATDPERVNALLTFVIVGAGATGVEMAGAMKEVAIHTLRDNFRTIRPRDARIILVEGDPRVLAAMPKDLSEEALAALKRLGVEVMLNTRVTNVQPGRVTLHTGDQTMELSAGTVIWAAGVAGTALTKALADATGAKTDRAGRVMIQDDLSIPNFPDIYVIGDAANFTAPNEKPLPGVAQVAIQQGRHASTNILRRLEGKSTEKFEYNDLGTLATIGRASAVAQIGRLHLHGLIAWMIWLFVHLMTLVQFQNRVLVFIQWTWSYLTWNRTARLITGRSELPPPAHPQ